MSYLDFFERGYTYFRNAVGYLKEYEEKDETISLFDLLEGIV